MVSVTAISKPRWCPTIGSASGTPAKMPRPVVAKLHTGVVQAMKAPDVRQSLTDLSLDIVGNTPEQFATVIRTDIDKWMKLAKNAQNTKPANK